MMCLLTTQTAAHLASYYNKKEVLSVLVEKGGRDLLTLKTVSDLDVV